ncbi:MAG: hypothetical protein KGD68_07105 [Candidatus Lokiarchaeota archaeon]|nr:hypothetical protein [Candidatus Lokiarchaeota archaeon]
MLILISVTSIAFDFRNVFAIGVYNIEDDYFNSYSDGTAGINLLLSLDRADNDRYTINSFIEPISTGDVVNYGLLSIIILYLSNNELVFDRSVQFGTPRSSYSVDGISLEFFKGDNLTCNGMIEMSLETGGIPKNDSINFQLTFIVPLDTGDYMNYELAIYAFVPLHFLLYIIVPVILFWIFKPLFGIKFSEEDIKRDEKFLNHLDRLVIENSKDSKN